MNLYEINIRVFRHRFGLDTKLLDIPDAFWKNLVKKGIDYVWLMGVWQTPAQEKIWPYALQEGLKEEYSRALPDWSKEDVIGSPYAVDQYILHTDLGQPSDLKTLKQRLNKLGLKLILDFVPNHFHAESSLIATHPEIFLQVPLHYLQQGDSTYYSTNQQEGIALAHGKDPHFAAWTDTVQVNYTSSEARAFMQQQVLNISKYCDGLRCDMAMLPSNEIFDRTWGHLGLTNNHQEEFWPQAIQETKRQQPDFIFIAEVYWDMEWELQSLGFDYTYDKRLLDRLLEGEVDPIRFHLRADRDFQEKSVRFLENHDETAIAQQLDTSRAEAAAIITYFQKGLRFFHNGQWEGRKHRLPVQLGRAPQEPISNSPVNKHLQDKGLFEAPFQPISYATWLFYNRLLQILALPIFRNGSPQEIDLQNPRVLAYRWTLAGADSALVIVNYSSAPTRINLPQNEGQWTDLFGGDIWAGNTLLSPFQYLVIKTS